MKRLPFRRGGALVLALAALAAVAMALWLGVFQQERAAASPDVDLTVTLNSTPASGTTLAQGSTISYTAIVASDGATSAGGTITLAIDLSNATLVASSFSSPNLITCTGTDPIDCQVPDFTAAGTKTVSFNATVGATGPVLVGATIDPPLDGSTDEVDEGALTDILKDEGDDPDTGHDCAAVGEGNDTAPDDEPDNFDCTSHAVGAADLTIGKTAVPAEGTILPPGSVITYTLIASNAGSGTAPNVLIRDILGTGLTYSSAGGTGVTCTHPSAQQIDCIVTSLAPGVPATVTVVATVAASAGTLLNGAYIDPANAITETNEEGDDPTLECTAVGEVVGGTADPDNFDCIYHTGGAVDLTITKTASPIESIKVTTGGSITYTLTVANSTSTGATTTATNVLIRDTLGTGLTYSSATSTGATCTHPSAQQIDCTVASLAAGSSVTVTVIATVSATTGTVFNGARVDPASAITETNEDADDPDYDCTAVGELTTTATEPDNFDCTRHTLSTGSPTPTPTVTPTATVTAGALTPCPLSGKWAMSVWTGSSGKPIAEALATCTSVTIDAAYSLDPTNNTWLKYFPAHTDISDLLYLNNLQAIFTTGH
ncbi:MAG: DUF11 domain-containing protein [Dehalococcoidia bacterium]|nr:DUF11 domain-containing protein [Dehalococcoidia bacterium]